jgi:hypothetical protein
MLALFAPDAEIEFGGHTYHGLDEMRGAFSSVRPHTSSAGGRSAYLRHCVATHQIDLVDATSATGRCYFFVLTRVGLDHWGRYLDDYRLLDGDWRFARRHVLTDALSPDSIFVESRERAGDSGA